MDNYPTRVGAENITACKTAMADNDDGYIIIPDLLIDHELIEVANFAKKAEKDKTIYKSYEVDRKAVRSCLGFHDRLEWLHGRKDIAAAITRHIGPSYIHQSRINYKRGMSANGWKWHSDFETWHYQDGMPEPLAATLMIALTDNTPFNGPLIVMAGSHRYFASCAKPDRHYTAEENFADQKEGVPSDRTISMLQSMGCEMRQICLKAGDAILFDCNLLHSSTASVSPGHRTNLFFVYNAEANRLVSPYGGGKPRPVEMGWR